MSHHRGDRKAELPTQGADLVLEEESERLDHLHLHSVGKAAHVVVGLDDAGGALVGGGLDDVGVQRALQEKAILMGETHLRHGLLKSLHEESANDLPLLLRLRDSRQLLVEVSGGIQHLELHPRDVALQALFDDGGLIFSQKPGVHHKRSEAISNRFVDQRCCNAGIDTATHGAHHVLVLHLAHNDVNLPLAEVVHVPLAFAAHYLEHKVLDHDGPRWRVRHLWVELDAVEVPGLVFHGGELGVGGVGDGVEAGWDLGDLVTVAHPHGHALRRDALEDGAPALHLLGPVLGEVRHVVADQQLRVPELALGAGLHLAPQSLAHLLEPIANAEDRELLLVDVAPDVLAEVGGVLVVDGVGPAAQDDALGVEASDVGECEEARPQLAVDPGFPDPAADQVAHLGPEVDHQQPLLLLHARHHVNTCLAVGHDPDLSADARVPSFYHFGAKTA
mmetsp:Transcript_74073/g.176653  ORF Transcript_74073/g.176653 Transcript_74073/m.176653 type:complete len:448 (-) Transcript_74073:3-1346(-)